MRRHLYLITSHPDDDRIGLVESREKSYTVAEKNTETRVDKRNIETGEGFAMTVVGLGYHDFEDREDYDENFKPVVDRKLADVDPEHLEAAGLDPADYVEVDQ